MTLDHTNELMLEMQKLLPEVHELADLTTIRHTGSLHDLEREQKLLIKGYSREQIEALKTQNEIEWEVKIRLGLEEMMKQERKILAKQNREQAKIRKEEAHRKKIEARVIAEWDSKLRTQT